MPIGHSEAARSGGISCACGTQPVGLGHPVCVALCVFLALAGAPIRAEDAAFFESKIRPILVERCYECHSAGKKQKGNLLLDSKAGALKGGDTSPPLFPAIQPRAC